MPMQYDVYGNPMPRPDYIPPPYAYAGLTFDQLPRAAQVFLIRQGLAQYDGTMGTPDSITLHDARDAIALKLFRTLTGVDTHLVACRVRVAAIQASIPDAEWPPTGDAPASPEAAAATAELAAIAHQVWEVLVPEWRAHADNYMVENDTLVWLELGAGTDLYASPYADPLALEAYRMRMCAAVIKGAIDELLLLERNAAATLLRDGWQVVNGRWVAPPPTPPQPSAAPTPPVQPNGSLTPEPSGPPTPPPSICPTPPPSTPPTETRHGSPTHWQNLPQSSPTRTTMQHQSARISPTQHRARSYPSLSRRSASHALSFHSPPPVSIGG
ncbi:hypothetical protein B0H10DRAFT_1991827 [Mycena sp. CBHHK59/15]|nr:hypothetical protein B0H10DRAFT_1991827 [Mycena sp. CBHHK59/15]